MAPSTHAASKPKRKRQRRRRQQSDSSSDSSSSSSDSEEEAPPPPAKLPTPSASSDSSASDSSSDSSSSESDLSDDGRGRRRGRGRRKAAGDGGAATSTQPQASTSQGAAPAADARRPYPSRSPSPAGRYDPTHVPLGSSLFPLLKPLADGPILQGFVPGDLGYGQAEGQPAEEVVHDGEKVQREKAREERFGEWWRARLVSEFEGDLGGLAAEPGLTPARLELLLTSLTTLSSLHTTSASTAAASRSIWLHDPSTAFDPLSAVATGEDGGAEEWGKAPIGGEGDVEVGEEGVAMDEKRDAGRKKEDVDGMDVDE
ncbi:hypothetical protein JCM21900_002996 [Sporobolomyces salmonicolor]